MNLKKISDISRNKKNQLANKTKRAIEGKYKDFHTLCIITGQNSNTEFSGNRINRQNNKQLVDFLKQSYYQFCPVIGKWGTVENSYAIFNISLDTAKRIAGKYEQTAFVFIVMKEDSYIAELYSKTIEDGPYDRISNPYILKEEAKSYKLSEDDDNFTQIGNRFKFSFDFESLDKIKDALKLIGCSANLFIDGVGFGAYCYRKKVMSH